MYLIDLCKICRWICPSADVEHLCARCLVRYMKEWDRQASNRQEVSWKNNSGSKMIQIMISAVKSTAQCNRESISMGKGGPRGKPILADDLWAQPKAGKKPGVWGELEEEQGVLSMFTDTRESSVAGGWSGKASDACWMREVVGAEGQDHTGLLGYRWRFPFSFLFLKYVF